MKAGQTPVMLAQEAGHAIIVDLFASPVRVLSPFSLLSFKTSLSSFAPLQFCWALTRHDAEFFNSLLLNRLDLIDVKNKV